MLAGGPILEIPSSLAFQPLIIPVASTSTSRRLQPANTALSLVETNAFTFTDAFTNVPIAAIEGAAESSSQSIINTIVHNPTFWSFNVMLVIVGLLYSWEQFVEYAKEETPAPIIPVIEKMLGEMGGLGFIGLVLSALLNQAALGEVVGDISEKFLGEKDILLESFEFLHETFFQAAIAFFATSAFIIVRVLWSFQAIFDLTAEEEKMQVSYAVASILDAPTIEKAARVGRFLDQDNPDCLVQMQDGFMEECMVEQSNPVLRELTLSPEARGAEILVIRERLKQEFNLSDDFEIRTYLENTFASCKLDLVEISPLSWLPLIPAIALANSVDLSHDVMNPLAGNAAEASGYFLSTPFFFLPKLSMDVLCFGWGLHNFWKMACIKSMLIPTVVRLEGEEGAGRLLPPAVSNADRRREFQARSTPFWAKPVEQLYAAPPTNRVEELFGVAGGNGLSLYLNSIKFHTWLVVASLVVFTSQILPRDLYALTHLDTVQVGDPDSLIPEVVVFGLFALVNIAQLAVQPTTVLNFCLISCVEENVDSAASDDALPAGATQGPAGEISVR
jgi:hypothetical protein